MMLLRYSDFDFMVLMMIMIYNMMMMLMMMMMMMMMITYHIDYIQFHITHNTALVLARMLIELYAE